MEGTVREPFWKRPCDFLLSLLGLILSAPLWVLIPFAIWAEDGRPIFYFQERVGRHGKRFRLWKFRSMICDAEARHGPVAAAERDPRVTKVGRFLRQSAMDELPQLINILHGDMSFVGPRADRLWEAGDRSPDLRGPQSGRQRIAGPSARASVGNPDRDFYQAIPGYRARLLVRPGLTGLAQVYARYDTPRRQKLRFDRLYIRNMSFWLDVKLIFLSCWITLRRKWESPGKKL